MLNGNVILRLEYGQTYILLFNNLIIIFFLHFSSRAKLLNGNVTLRLEYGQTYVLLFNWGDTQCHSPLVCV